MIDVGCLYRMNNHFTFGIGIECRTTLLLFLPLPPPYKVNLGLSLTAGYTF